MTLVEAVVSMTIVGIMLVAALNAVGTSTRGRQLRQQASQAAGLTQQLMAEILQAGYEEPEDGIVTFQDSTGDRFPVDLEAGASPPVFGPEPGETDGTRMLFDDVDDYRAWQSTPPEERDGAPLPEHADWRREVAVAFVNPLTLADLGTPTETGLKRVEVTVVNKDGRDTTLVALKSAVGAFDSEPNVETTFVAWVGVMLQTGRTTTPVVGGAMCVNQVPLAGP
jgi:type II secretory pathway pseudopilin PulG